MGGEEKKYLSEGIWESKKNKDIENVGKMLLSLSLYKKDKLKFNTSISKYPERSLKQLVRNT